MPVSLQTQLSKPSGGDLKVHVRNISPDGFMADTPEPVPLGSIVTLTLPGIGPVQARVQWAAANRIGCFFASEVSLSALRQAAPEAMRPRFTPGDSA